MDSIAKVKHINVMYHFIRQGMSKGRLELVKTDNKLNLVDGLNKIITLEIFSRHFLKIITLEIFHCGVTLHAPRRWPWFGPSDWNWRMGCNYDTTITQMVFLYQLQSVLPKLVWGFCPILSEKMLTSLTQSNHLYKKIGISKGAMLATAASNWLFLSPLLTTCLARDKMPPMLYTTQLWWDLLWGSLIWILWLHCNAIGFQSIDRGFTLKGHTGHTHLAVNAYLNGNTIAEGSAATR